MICPQRLYLYMTETQILILAIQRQFLDQHVLDRIT